MSRRGLAMKDEKEWEQELAQEGLGDFFVWHDGPNAFYSNHTHDELTAHVILEGEMTITSQGQTRTYRAGERLDVPAHTVHSARMGPQGCHYLIGRK
jgi:mannose-6-phosphate isomerase-like protein (cupin superfamily)